MQKVIIPIVLCFALGARADFPIDPLSGTWRIPTPHKGEVAQPERGHECKTLAPLHRLLTRIVDKGAAFAVDIHGDMMLLVAGTDPYAADRNVLSTHDVHYAFWSLDPATVLSVCLAPGGKTRVVLDVSITAYQLDGDGKRIPEQSCVESWHGAGFKEQ